MSGYVGNLSIQQQDVLDRLKREIKEEGLYDEKRHDDPTLLRFCRAKKFEYGEVKKMVVAAEQWRKDFGVDDIVANFQFTEKAEVDKYYTQFYHKVDKDGRPIYIELLGKVNITELHKVTTPERLLKRLVWEYEKSLRTRIPACTKATGHPVESFCTILDLSGMGLGFFLRGGLGGIKDSITAASNIANSYYPETMGWFYIINAPWGFSVVWSMVKGWLDTEAAAKIQVLGRTELLKQIDARNLPTQLGGQCECPGGCATSDAGPWKA